MIRIGLHVGRACLRRADFYDVPGMWSFFALQAKRWHDRGKSAGWALLGFFPLANIWVTIEVGFLAGTPGPNEYGPLPP